MGRSPSDCLGGLPKSSQRRGGRTTGRVQPDSRVPRPPVVGNTLKPSPADTVYGGKVGDNFPPGREHEPRQGALGAPNPDEDVDGNGKRGHRRGRKRKARSMGRPLKDPFGAAAARYLDKVGPFRSEYTIKELRRKLRHIGAMLHDLHMNGVIQSMEPKRFERETIGALLVWMRQKGFSSEYQAKILVHLGLVLDSVQNNVIRELRALKMLPQRPGPKPIFVKSEDWLREALAKLESLDGWMAEIVRFAMQVYFWTGLRVRELRLARRNDVDLTTWTMRISAPKGLGRWATGGERVLIVQELRPVLMDFLAARSRMLERMGIADVEWLIPDTIGRAYTCDRWNSIRYKVFRQAGIQGDFRILRPSFAMKLKELGMVLDDRSRLLRHTSTETTAKFYSNMESLEPWRRVEEHLANNRLIS